jgi:translation elongation factor EF-Tu-like GTPase
MASEYQYDFTAYISFLPSELGGRKKKIYSGFRPTICFKSDRYYSSELFFDTPVFLEPGSNAIVTVKLLPAVTIPKNLSVNDTFKITEGTHVIGTGIIKSEIIKKEAELFKQ